MYLYGGIENYIGTLCHINKIEMIYLIEIIRTFILGDPLEDNNCLPKQLAKEKRLSITRIN